MKATTNDQISVDLLSDFSDKCGIELQKSGYSRPIGSNEDIIRAYINVRHRRVQVRSRRVYKAKYSVPSNLATGEQKFLKKVVVGDDLRPHQSTRIEQANFDDGMLNDFGIHHFHLGTRQHPNKPEFVARTDPVLFALVKGEDFYSLGCYGHGAWSQTSLLYIIHENWPEAIKECSIKDVSLLRTYTDAEHSILRDSRINVLTQKPDQTVHIGPGGGITSAGGSARVLMEIIEIKNLCIQLENYLKSKIRKMIDSGKILPPAVLRLQYRNGETYADIDNFRGTINLNRCLSVPPL